MRLKKPLYGLDNASRKFWLHVKEVLRKIGMKIMEGDEGFYYLHRYSYLQGCMTTHVVDFTLAGSLDFIKEVLEMIEGELTISKIERDNFHFTVLDICMVDDSVVIGWWTTLIV